MRVSDLCRFIERREAHRDYREGTCNHSFAHLDPIISKYRFCNVRRNDDRVTKWVFEHYMDYYRSSPYVWFALVVARLFNNEATLEAIRPHVLPFSPANMKKVLRARAKAGDKNFNAAYIVSTNGLAMDKVDYVVDNLLKPLWRIKGPVTEQLNNCATLAEAHRVLTVQRGLGSFMAAQVLADWKYLEGKTRWSDFNEFAASGPGSRRGLNRVMGRDLKAPWREEEFRTQLSALREKVNLRLCMEPLTAQDLQNCLCEFDKYERARTGEGRPKQKYQTVYNKEKRNANS